MMVRGKDYNIIIEKGDDGYLIGFVPGMVGAHSQAKSKKVLMKRMKDVIELCLSVYEEPISIHNGVVGAKNQVKLPYGRIAST
ncbi:MAG: type II toxin-antitoxin system HicB family antitoxin [Candidatus Micrarchaeota archaeon]|mgnify:CR=1 FL=1